ncbi:tail fiber assembly protein [Pseudanabaena phage Pam3]|uniref:Tail fiber assembly protein n=1 Tax=Pseudanabaena phage Pam3 TaxID=2936519 RepID=A0ACD6BAN8_9CAUD|nr:tail fiber assembly protein [Pseudanabaena phage Pam3]7YPX_a Chain a, tail fiber chaperone [uncultured cyanophage]7YPX_b Chain b, tail fiber chaperone [uncultured cyanophage]7YPX_c Chain c, tail fiber chaperone [uncultured cyanophage]
MTDKHYARVVDGLVVETKTLPADFNLDDLFGPDHGWVEAPLEVEQGWRKVGAKFAPAPPPERDPASILAGLKAEASRHIFATISATAQSNLLLAVGLASAKAPSARTPEERDLLNVADEGRAWIDAVRARVHALAEHDGVTPKGEDRWPAPSEAVLEMAAKF